MKRILGLDLGTTSIGWALVNEAEANGEISSIIATGVRVNPLTTDETKNFSEGKSIETNAERRQKRGMRRNLERYKQRRETLRKCLMRHGFFDDRPLSACSTLEIWRLRAKAAVEPVTLDELVRVLFLLNKKRGYKSNRKMQNNEKEGKAIDGMNVALEMAERGLTPGQYALGMLREGKKRLPDFYPSDLQTELDRIYAVQQAYYPEMLTPQLHDELRGKNEKQTWAICAKHLGISGMKREGKKGEQTLENYHWRAVALNDQLGLEELVIVFQQINKQIASASGYLGAISDRSKTLRFNNQTVGQYLLGRLEANVHNGVRGEVFYRQDYLDEFNRIWQVQASHHVELTDELRDELRDDIIFYQRPLRSQKKLVGFCEFEQKEIDVEKDGKTCRKIVGLRACPKASPLFQAFKVWQTLGNVKVSATDERERRPLTLEEKQLLYEELSLREKLSKTAALKLLFATPAACDMNFDEIEGNRTDAALFKAFCEIAEISGHDAASIAKMPAAQARETLADIFETLGIDPRILTFNPLLPGKDFEQQPAYKLWHLLYSYEGDKSISGNDALYKKLEARFGLVREYAEPLVGLVFPSDYGNLSAKALRKILSGLMEGLRYDEACTKADYRHSDSLTAEENASRVLADRLSVLPRGALRNPVVEKILNQMVHVVNGVLDAYGSVDEVRIELARELKKNAREREQMTKDINAQSRKNEEIRQILVKDFHIVAPTKNDILRYRLYKELEANAYKSLYSHRYIPAEAIFSPEIEIEHIIPKARLFNDSFSNKTLEWSDVNKRKGNATALDFVSEAYGEEGLARYRHTVEELYKQGAISTAKRKNLLISENNIPEEFLNRDLSQSQYIARKAREMLFGLVRSVVSTTGSITARLREDWGIVDVMKELNWAKYARLGLTEETVGRDDQRKRTIQGWTKRNDHRHHAMDALTIAFTKPALIQYLNNLNARSDKNGVIYAIERRELLRDERGKLLFRPPFGTRSDFRAAVKQHLEQTLVSIKAKNKVVTVNINLSRKRGGVNRHEQLTPRGQLHKETIYGSIRRYATKEERVNGSFTLEKIATVADRRYREALIARLAAFDGDAKKAFTGKNTLDKQPLLLPGSSACVPVRVKTVTFEQQYVVRKDVGPDLKVDKVIDAGIRRILQERLDRFGGDAKKAFVNLDEDPIYQNRERGIVVRSVRIRGVNNAIALHDKRDHTGQPLLDTEGRVQPNDFVVPGNNHHIAIYTDAEGELHDRTVSFFEAVERARQGLPVVDRHLNADQGWQLRFTLKQNEYFVFPNPETGFNPQQIDLTLPDNYALISPNLYRVQKITDGYYVFRHHLETTVGEEKALSGTTFKRVQSLPHLQGIVKVRINHIGRIVAVGEY